MVPGVSVEKSQELTSCGRVNQLVDLRKRKMVLRACLVQVDEIYAHPPFAIGLAYHYWVCKPLGMKHFSDEAGHEEFVKLFLDSFLAIGGKPT